MRFFDRNTGTSRLPEDVAPLITGLLENQQRFDSETQDAPYVTSGIKYKRDRQNRRLTTPYDGANPFVQDIIDIFGFDPLDFQVNAWEVVEEMDAKRRRERSEQAALFEAPTGFGKTEAFLGPLYKMLQENPEETAVIVYPRRALLQNQLERILEHLDALRDTGPAEVSAGVYMGGMPYRISDVEDNTSFFETGARNARFKLANCWCSEEGQTNALRYHGTSSEYTLKCEANGSHSFTDRELMLSRQDIANDPPNILLTTLESLELFGLKPNYDIIDDVTTIVLDEVHLYTGLRGSHTARIIQNINEVTEQALLWLGASATLDNPSRFAKKLFGVTASSIETVRPPDSDFKQDHDDKEHYYFLKSPEDGPGASSMMIQQLMLAGHSLLDRPQGQTGKILTFIDSISQVNQKQAQFDNADTERQLWQHHRSGTGPENWEYVAQGMGYDFRDDPLSTLAVYGDKGFDADQAADTDLLLSTSFLEVGIDVGDISIVSQYRTPQDLSSFIQRIGRAAREEDMDSHIFVFLSSLTGDSNMFYRAERFLGSDLRTPLKPDNPVVEWIHEQLRAYYFAITDVREERHRSARDEELAFYDAFIADSDGLEFPEFHQLLTEPGEFLDAELGICEHIDQPLLSEPYLRAVVSALEAKQESLQDEFADLNDVIDIEGEEVVKAENAFEEYLKIVQTRILEVIQDYESYLETYTEALDAAGDSSKTDLSESVAEELTRTREQIESYRSYSREERVEKYNELLADLVVTASKLKRVRAPADTATDESVPDVSLGRIDDLQTAVNRLSGLAGDDRLERLSEQRRQIFYLRKTVRALLSYRGLDNESVSASPKPYLSVWYVKDLLRAAYYFNRFLAVDDRATPNEVWYVPQNYFDSSGQYFTVFDSDTDRSGHEESIDSIVHTYAPYRSEYQASTGSSKLFMPETEVVEASTKETTSTVEFDFEGLPTDDQPNLRIPESITLSEVTDLTGDSAQNIIRYCPECLQIISDTDRCLRHNDRALGKIHSDPQVQTIARDRTTNDSTGGLALCELTGEVALEGVTLNITPAEYKGPEIGYGWADADQIEREIKSRDPPLGFTLDTRGLVLDLSDYLDQLDERLREEVAQFKELDAMAFEDVAYHTAAHFLLQVVADIGGVNPSMLFYGIDQSRQEVFVFERTEGGQGVVDLVYEELSINPGNVLAAMNRTAFNPQVLNERLWANREVIDALPTDQPLSETAAAELVADTLEIPYQTVRERVAEELITTADRCMQLAESMDDISLTTAHRVKHEIATAQLEGETEFPQARLAPLGLDAEAIEETVQSLFFSPDIDGCVENLHLSGCISGHSQEESLSYRLLEELYDHCIETTTTAEATSTILDTESIPAAEVDGTNVFITF